MTDIADPRRDLVEAFNANPGGPHSPGVRAFA